MDQTLHWANPQKVCADGVPRTDCKGTDPTPYTGPVPIITHVHGAHVKPDSDGYPEAWYLPYASNIPAGYARAGTLFDDVTGTNAGNLGYADFSYQNDQPATTLWYHDHTLGMTRVNVYAGPAGFWLIRGGSHDLPYGLPGPAPTRGQGVLELNVPGDPVRSGIREIPIVIQDRAFNTDGSLFYPFDRAFFEGLSEGQAPPHANANLQIPFAPDSDVAPIWNPEAFFNVMVVNGVSWPSLDVAKAQYRFRLLNGCNSRFLNLALKIVDSPNASLIGTEIPFYQIGAEQGFLPKVVRVQTGEALELNGTNPLPNPSADPTALLMGLAERADVIVDFRDIPDGTVVHMTNTAPDAPFGGFPDDPADPATTGQVMRFVVNNALTGLSTTDPGQSHQAHDPWTLYLPAEAPLSNTSLTRNVSLNELESHGPDGVCVLIDAATEEYILDNGVLVEVPCTIEDPGGPGVGSDVVPFGPTEALLGLVEGGLGTPLTWTDKSGKSFPVEVKLNNSNVPVTIKVTENPKLGDTEEWEIYNFTADAHPIHLHLVRFEVVKRTQIDGTPGSVGGPLPDGVQPWESGFKDTVIAYPGEITTVKAKFDIEGLYVWHCHIVEHEDNEMMRPFVVSAAGTPGNEVLSFSLYDADTDSLIGPLVNGAILDIAGKNVNMGANVASKENGTQSVILTLKRDGVTIHTGTENLDPYTLFGDNGMGDIFPGVLVPGYYTLLATPYSDNEGGGTAGISLTISFTVKSAPASDNRIVKFVLWNADTDAPIVDLVHGGTVILTGGNIGANLNVEAVAFDKEGATQSVFLNLNNGGFTRTESAYPYMLGGDTGGDIFDLASSALTLGVEHTITATPYSANGLGGTSGNFVNLDL